MNTNELLQTQHLCCILILYIPALYENYFA